MREPDVRGDAPRLVVPGTVAEALAVQDRLRPLVDLVGPGPEAPATVAGLDVAYAEEGDRLAAAVTVLDARTLAVVDSAVAVGRPAFGYVPGLFAFRELPALLDALERLRVLPELLVCDGHGLAHPRRFGLACHLGVVTGLPAIGVGKTPLVGGWTPPGERRGAWTPLSDGGQVVGRVLRTRDGVKPVFVSVGHRVSLDNATARVLALTPRFRLPETTRTADRLCRNALAAAAPRRGTPAPGRVARGDPARRPARGGRLAGVIQGTSGAFNDQGPPGTGSSLTGGSPDGEETAR